MTTRARARSTWRRKRWPRPRPSLAPSTRPGDVGDDELRRRVVGPGTEADHAEVRLERRERVLGDLRFGGGNPRDERRLAAVGEADEGDIGDELQLEVEPALLTQLALLGEGRCAQPVGEEPGVAGPPRPPSAAHRRSPGAERSARTSPSGRRTTVPTGTGTTRSPAGPAVALGPAAVGARLGAPVRVVPKGEERGERGRRLEVDVAAAATVAAVRPTARDVRLVTERNGARPAVTGSHVDLGLVDEASHLVPFSMGATPRHGNVGAPRVEADRYVGRVTPRWSRRRRDAGRAVRRNERCRPPRRTACRPRRGPTLTPGWKCVPRWRTMIAPAPTTVPSEAFTPSRWALESRPLRVDPPPLVLDTQAPATWRCALPTAPCRRRRSR